MTDAEADTILTAMNTELNQIAIINRHFQEESLCVPFADTKREICAYYGVPMEQVNTEYHRYQAIWRCYQWDRAAQKTVFPDEKRIETQLREPALPAAENGPET